MTSSKTAKMRKLFADKQVSAEQLENVAGGTVNEMADDSRFLNVLLRGHPAQCDRYCGYMLDIAYGAGDRRREVKAAWEAVGVTWDCKAWSQNSYIIDGNYVSREEAWAHAEKVMGKKLQKSDWYWEN